MATRKGFEIDWADSTQDRFTAYQYGPSDSGTEQTDKKVYAWLNNTGAVLEDDSYSFNLQGEMAGVVTDLVCLVTDGISGRFRLDFPSTGCRIIRLVPNGTGWIFRPVFFR